MQTALLPTPATKENGQGGVVDWESVVLWLREGAWSPYNPGELGCLPEERLAAPPSSCYSEELPNRATSDKLGKALRQVREGRIPSLKECADDIAATGTR